MFRFGKMPGDSWGRPQEVVEGGVADSCEAGFEPHRVGIDGLEGLLDIGCRDDGLGGCERRFFSVFLRRALWEDGFCAFLSQESRSQGQGTTAPVPTLSFQQNQKPIPSRILAVRSCDTSLWSPVSAKQWKLDACSIPYFLAVLRLSWFACFAFSASFVGSTNAKKKLGSHTYDA